MSKIPACPRPTRPVLGREDRCQAMLDAAEELFLEQGFERTTLSAVVARSGGSLATLYAEFGNKQQLLRAVVARGREEELGDLLDLCKGDQSPREQLRIIAQRLHAFLMTPKTLALARMVIAHSLAHPGFGLAFHNDIRVRMIDRLAEIFTRWTEDGRARIPDPVPAAELYFSSVLCDAPVKAMMGVPPEPTDPAVLDRRLQPFFEHFRIQD
jgi:TetR/AcrR family transcriptional repressor of mexJK operon